MKPGLGGRAPMLTYRVASSPRRPWPMATVTRPTLAPKGSVLLGTAGSPPPSTRCQLLPPVADFHTPARVLDGARPMLPRPTISRPLLKRSSTRSVTDGMGVPTGWPMLDAVRTLVQLAPPSF